MLNTFFGYLFGLGLLTIALYLFVFAILEKKWAAEPGQPLSAYFLNIRITILYAIASSFFSGVSAGAIAKAGTSLGLGLIDLRFYPGNTILQVIVGIFIVAITDFFYYWFHRLQHMIPALWAQHKVHHLDEYLNASTANRHHWLEELLRIPFLAVPLAVLFKFDPMPAGIIGILFTAWGYFIHANLRFELGHVSRVLGGPQAHRIHHSRLEEHYNKNFAPFIPIWDIIFRTYHHPKSGEFPPTGIVGEKVSSMTHAALLPILVWLKTCFKTWNTSVKDHCEHLDIRFLFIIGISLTLSTIIYFMIPEQQSLLKIFSPEHTALYGFVDSFPQRISYIIFLCLIIVSVFILKLTPISNKSITVGKFWPVLSILLFLALLLNLRIFEFTFQSQMIILLTILIAYTAFKPKLN